ncbi:ankyrin repeat domain-containing protein SOWAHB [Candoia aspera]|uniref:ankyrin repeat domain-containing protein SOWAHB n=1 Tax=Candoia aspera TaxID=51853 RepID=UPI002FD87634
MAQELSQAELLDFLCRAGGRVANAALLGHFRRFLRAPDAPPAELQHRRELFKGFVNSVATVRQEGPDAAKYVVLRKRYRELVGEEPKPPPVSARCDGRTAESPPVPPGRPLQPHQAGWERARRAPGAACRGAVPGPRREAERAGRRSDGELVAGRRAGRCLPGAPGTGAGPPLPAHPAVGCLESPPAPCALAGGKQCRRPRPAEPAAPEPLLLQEGAQKSNGLRLPVGETGALPSAGSVQQRIRDWIVTHHSAFPEPFPPLEEEACLVRACPPRGSLDSQLRPASPEVFRSIRCQLSLQDLEDHIKLESSASEESSSASRESNSQQEGGEMGRVNGCIQNSVWCEGPEGTPHINGLVVPLAQASQGHRNGKSPLNVSLLHQVVRRATTLGQAEDRDSKWQSKDRSKPKRMGRPPSPNLDAPLTLGLVPRQGPVAHAPFVERLAPSTEGSAEHRSSLVPLDSREHAWLVKVATGSWMQAQVLLREDPHLALRRDFISGFTVLHWLAKHGNAQVLQDFVTGAREAGIVLDVNVRSGCGYTPLHLAAIHSHPLVMKILVQRLRCQTQARDSTGKKPWQYLSASVSGEIWQLLEGPRGRTIFPAHPIVRASSSSNSSPARKVSRKSSLAAYLKPQHMKWKRGTKCPPLQETEEYSD